MKTELESISPETARKYLGKNTENRPIRQSWVEALAGMMQRGEWKLLHQGIAFDDTGRLVDGQHRLLAILSSGVTVKMTVTRDLEPESYRYIDGGAKRSISDRLKLLNDPNINTIAIAIVRAYIAHGALGDKTSISVQMIEDHFLEGADAFTSVASAFSQRIIGVTRADIGAAIASYIQVHFPEGQQFLTGYLTSHGHEEGSPMLALRDGAIMRRIRHGADAYWKGCAATRAHFEGRRVASLQSATVDWFGNRYDRLHFKQKEKAKQSAETRKRKSILAEVPNVNGRHKA